MKKPGRPPPDELFTPRKQKAVPFPFVLDALASMEPSTRPMFGCLAVYVEDKVVLILRDKPAPASDNGVWLATTAEHHASLRGDLPSMRSISVLGSGTTGWQMLPSDEPEFEEEALRAVALILAGDERIGKVPKAKRPRGPREKPAAKKAAKTTGTVKKATKIAGTAKKAARATGPAKKAAKTTGPAKKAAKATGAAKKAPRATAKRRGP